jgi:NAD(P)-dependent dehydrogenase (short-subunit alcohol dehydrogenase family)
MWCHSGLREERIQRGGAKMAGQLEGKVAIVTGAGAGIGKASALSLARQGAKVLVTDVNLESAQAVASQIKSAGGDAQAARVDVSQASEIRQMIAIAEDVWGGLDCLLNNAESCRNDKLDILLNSDDEFWMEQVRGKIMPVFYGIKYSVPAFRRRGGGAIVNTASVSGLGADYGVSFHNVGKHGVIGLTKAAAIELAQYNIRVNALCPGFTRTENNTPDVEPWPTILKYAHPMARVGEAREQGDAAAFLLSDAASFITGVALNVDGGLRAENGYHFNKHGLNSSPAGRGANENAVAASRG